MCGHWVDIARDGGEGVCPCIARACAHSPNLLNGTTRFHTHWITDNLHVTTPAREVIRHFWDRIPAAERSVDKRPIRHAVYRTALERHQANRETYEAVMGGNL